MVIGYGIDKWQPQIIPKYENQSVLHFVFNCQLLLENVYRRYAHFMELVSSVLHGFLFDK